MSSDRILYTNLESPIGDLLLVSDGEALTGLYMGAYEKGPKPDGSWRRDNAALAFASVPLTEYFAGERQSFAVPFSLAGTEFQKRVWEGLLTIPYGETISYAELARRVGAPTGARAVGAALGRNPVSIVVPCHRVIGSSGTLVGFGGRLDRKRWLLDLERECRAGASNSLFPSRLMQRA